MCRIRPPAATKQRAGCGVVRSDEFLMGRCCTISVVEVTRNWPKPAASGRVPPTRGRLHAGSQVVASLSTATLTRARYVASAAAAAAAATVWCSFGSPFVRQSRYGAHVVFRHQAPPAAVGTRLVFRGKAFAFRCILKDCTPWIQPGSARSGKDFDGAGLLSIPITSMVLCDESREGLTSKSLNHNPYSSRLVSGQHLYHLGSRDSDSSEQKSFPILPPFILYCAAGAGFQVLQLEARRRGEASRVPTLRVLQVLNAHHLLIFPADQTLPN